MAEIDAANKNLVRKNFLINRDLNGDMNINFDFGRIKIKGFWLKAIYPPGLAIFSLSSSQ
jgi:hypothetical protein